MEDPITISLIFRVLEGIVALVAGGVAIKALLNCITSIHDRNKKIDTYATEIDTVKAQIKDLKDDNDVKMQAIRDEQCIITESMLAILDGLHQLNCNGPVTEAKDNLTLYLNNSAHRKSF
jgi:outer membrane murein-binding lipoprotein Lpp